MQEEKLIKEHEEEFQYLKERINAIPKKDIDAVNQVYEKEAKAIAKFVRDKIGMLKACYDKSDATVKESIHQLIRYPQLRYFLADVETKKIKLEYIVYTPKMIHNHINRLPDKYRVLEFYSFYFGRYRLFFRCFGRDFLENEKLDEKFIEDIFSAKEGDYYVSGEILKIPGAEIIDKEFISNTKKSQEFSMVDYYTGMLDEDCQWFGVTQGWFVERGNFQEVKDIIKTVFESRRTLKISLVVHGNPGAGKTSYLRYLASVLYKEQSFTIVWLNNKTEDFLDQGLKTIEETPNTNFLVFIEDWETFFGKKDPAVVQTFLEETKNIKNIRIIIGDRIIDKSYENFLNNDIESLLLTSKDNEYIIEKITDHLTQWRVVSQKLFENPENYNCSLFLLLFIIAHINKEEQNRNSYNLSEAQTVFRSIIESDLNFIAKQEQGKYKGLAKSIYYWACMQVGQKVFVSYNTFLRVADYFNGNQKISDSFGYWESNESKILNTLKIYFTKNKDGLIQFNHDILAKEGISKISYPDWEEFGRAIKIQLLNVVTDYGDDDSASEFLSALIKKRFEMVLDDDGKWSGFEYFNLSLDTKEKLFYINKLINKRNRHPAYIKELVDLIQYYDEQLNQYAELLWENEIYTMIFWRKVLRTESMREFWLNKICTLENFIRIDRILIDHIVSDFNNERAVRSAVGDVLIDENWKNVHPDVLWSILLDIGGDNKEELQSFADKILKIVNCARLYTDITYISIKLASSNMRKKFINTIFNSRFSKTPNVILHECLNFINDDLKQKFAQKFFEEVNWEECESVIVTRMMEALESEERQNTIKNILRKKNYQATSYEILKYCLKTTSKTALKIEFIENVSALPLSSNTYRLYSIVLDHYYIADENLRDRLKNIFRESIEHTSGTDLICRYLKITKDPIMASFQLKYWIYSGFRFSKDFFPNGHKENYDNDLLSRCLMCFERNDSLPDEVELTIKKIISDFDVKKRESSPYYLLLLKLSFHHSISWKYETKKIIENWKMYDRRILYGILGSHLEFPEEIETLCKHIMLCWNAELNKITQQKEGDKEYGEHLIVAMGHPDLKLQAKQTARMMLQNKEYELSEDFIKLADNIVNKDKYPQWEPYDSDFIDLPIYRLNPIKFIEKS